MNELAFKYRLAICHFLSHAGVIVACLLFLFGPLDFPHIVPILSVVAPILAVYGPDIVKFVAQNKYKAPRGGPKLNQSFVAFSVVVFVVSHGLIYGIIAVYGFSGKMTPSQFQTAFGTIEVFFALYIGGRMRSLYQEEKPASAGSPPKPPKVRKSTTKENQSTRPDAEEYPENMEP